MFLLCCKTCQKENKKLIVCFFVLVFCVFIFYIVIIFLYFVTICYLNIDI